MVSRCVALIDLHTLIRYYIFFILPFPFCQSEQSKPSTALRSYTHDCKYTQIYILIWGNSKLKVWEGLIQNGRNGKTMPQTV